MGSTTPSAWSRRTFLTRAGGSALTLLGAAGLLAACGDDEEGAAGGSPTTAGGGAASDDIGARIRALLGLGDADELGGGLTIPSGASIILSGALAALGEDHLRGLELGVDHIRAAGGPVLELNVRDNGLDTTKGVANVREFAAAGCPIQFSDAAATLGSELPGYEENKILAIDPGGSIAGYAGSPYYYMTRPTPPEAYIGAQSRFMRERFTDARRWALIGSDAGTDYNAEEVRVSRSAIEAHDFEWAGDTHVAFDETDFASAFTRLADARADIIQVNLYGEQLGVFLRQYATSGLSAKLMGIDLTTSAQSVAGDAIDEYFFANDWFDPVNPTNDWASLVVEEYQRVHGEQPFYPAVQYYQAAFTMWDVIRRVLADGGDPTQAGTDAFLTAIEAIDSFPSVFGGDGARLGEFRFDDRHLPGTLQCTICSVSGEAVPEPLARFNAYDDALEML